VKKFEFECLQECGRFCFKSISELKIMRKEDGKLNKNFSSFNCFIFITFENSLN